MLVNLITYTDDAPARYLMALLAVTNDDALTHLDRCTVSNISAFVRDAMKREFIKSVLSD